MASMTKWEYLALAAPASATEVEDAFDRHGAKGWELICVTPYGMYIFKRPILED